MNYKHIYEGDEGTKFLRSEPATAVCGFVAEGPGTPSDEWCPLCRTMKNLSNTVEHW